MKLCASPSPNSCAPITLYSESEVSLLFMLLYYYHVQLNPLKAVLFNTYPTFTYMNSSCKYLEICFYQHYGFKTLFLMQTCESNSLFNSSNTYYRNITQCVSSDDKNFGAFFQIDNFNCTGYKTKHLNQIYCDTMCIMI